MKMDEAAGEPKQVGQNNDAEAEAGKGNTSLANATGTQDVNMDDGVDKAEVDAQNQQAKQYKVDDAMLARKLGQVIGFHFDVEGFSETNSEQKRVFNPQLLIALLKESGVEAQVIQEAEQAIEKSKLVKDE